MATFLLPYSLLVHENLTRFNSTNSSYVVATVPPALHTADDPSLVSKRLSPAGYVVAGVILTLIAIMGTFNNFCVVVVLLRNRALRTPVNLMLLNLSISDFVLACFGSPFTAGAAFANGWFYGRSFCVAYAFAMAVAGIASITSLAVISIERYLLIAHPGSVNITVRKTALAICGVWVYAFLVTFPPLVGWNKYDFESPLIACSMNWESTDFSNGAYIVYLFIFGLVIPVLIVLYAYTLILYKVIKGAGQSVAKGQGRITRMIIMMVAAFLFAWMPYAIVSLIVVFGGDTYITAAAAAAPAIFAKSSIVYNPIIYVLANPLIRSAFVAWITCNPNVRAGAVSGTKTGNFRTENASANRSSDPASRKPELSEAHPNGGHVPNPALAPVNGEKPQKQADTQL